MCKYSWCRNYHLALFCAWYTMCIHAHLLIRRQRSAVPNNSTHTHTDTQWVKKELSQQWQNAADDQNTTTQTPATHLAAIAAAVRDIKWHTLIILYSPFCFYPLRTKFGSTCRFKQTLMITERPRMWLNDVFVLPGNWFSLRLLHILRDATAPLETETAEQDKMIKWFLPTTSTATA